MSAADALIAVSDLSVHAGAKRLLQPLSFALGPGQALTLVGESGAGKSLLAQAVMGTLAPGLSASGSVRIAGRASAAADTRARRSLWGRVLGLLPQEPWTALNPTMRVQAQLSEVHRFVRGLPAAQAQAQGEREMHDIGIAHARRLYPWQLSGGMAQRAAFAIATAGGARVLLIDEPTKGLDAARREQVAAALEAARAAGGAIIAIAHDLRLAQRLGGQMLVLREGEVVEHGDARSVLAAPSHSYTRALIAADPARWPVRAPPAIGERLIEARGLAKRYGGRTLFQHVDLDVHAGERIAVLGASGVGKSTLGNILIGLQPADAGHLVRDPRRPAVAWQKLYQDPVSTFAARVSLRTALQDLVRLHGRPWTEMARRLEALRVPDSLLARRSDQVSGGELQRIALARVLLVDPALVFADEPTSRLDPITQRDAMDVLLSQAEQTGFALLMVTHDADLAATVAQRSVVLNDGRATNQDRPSASAMHGAQQVSDSNIACQNRAASP